MTKIRQGAFDPTTTPARVLTGAANDEPLDLLHDTRPTRPTPRVIGQSDPSVTELFEKDAALFPEEGDRGLLVTIDPACERR